MGTFIGVDIGTSSLKAVRVECDGDTVAVLQEVSLPYGEGGGPVRSPEVWVQRAYSALHLLGSGAPVGLGVTGQMHALVMVSRDGSVLAPTLLWFDMNGERQLRQFSSRFSDQMVSRTSNIPLPDFTLAKWLFASEGNPRLRRDIQALMGAKDYVRLKLDPNSEPCTDPSEATGTQLFNPFIAKWDYELSDAAGIPRHALLPVKSPETIVGTGREIDPSWKGTHVVVGAGDQAAAARAVGAFREGVVSISLGTSAVVSVPWRLAQLPTRWDGSLHLFPGTASSIHDVIATIPAFGPGLHWAAELLGGTIEDLDQRAANAVSSSRGAVWFFPYLNGSGAPHPSSTRRAVFAGVGIDTDRDSLARAVYDGFAMELATLLEEIKCWGVPVREVVISGGASVLKHLVETIAAFLNVPCYTVATSSASAVGAALIAYDALRPGAAPVLPRRPVRVSRPRSVSQGWLEMRDGILGC